MKLLYMYTRIIVSTEMGDLTVRRYTVLVCNQPLKPTQPPTLSRMGNEYRSRGSGSVVRLGR